MEPTNPPATPNTPLAVPKFNPILMALSNVILFGAAYLILHLYKRFFIVYGLMFVVIILISVMNVPLFGLVSASLGSLLSILLFVFVVIDTYTQTKKIVEGKMPFPPKQKKLSVLGTILIVLFIIAYSAVQIFVDATTPEPLYGVNSYYNR